MSKAPDLESLAKTYLELWQNQFQAMAADPELSEAMARLFSVMGGAPPGAGGLFDGEPTKRPAAGAKAAAAPSRDRGDDLDELARRLADIEKRLAALEAGAGGSGGGARGKPRKRRP